MSFSAIIDSVGFWEVCGVLTATAAACAVLGSFLVLRRMALLTDAIGHVLLLGIVLAFLIVRDVSSPLLVIGAAMIGLVTVALVEAVSKSRLVKEDAAIGLVFPALFALGVILTTYHARNMHLDVDAVLFGTPELAPLHRISVGEYDLGPVSVIVMSGMFLLNTAFVAVLFKELKLSTFDAGLAASLGFAPAVLHYALMGLVSLTAVTAFDAVGPVLVVAFFVVPAATAYLLTDRLAIMVALGVGIAVAGALLGTVVAYRLGVTISGTVAVVMGLAFTVALAVSPRHGLITLVMHRVRQRRDLFDTMLAIHLLQHEGTAEEATETRLATLHLHMNWPEPQAREISRRVVDRGWAVHEGDRLKLTPGGRQVATAAIGGRSSVAGESVS
jgi:manganese/zinc/iron transport system permease protein